MSKSREQELASMFSICNGNTEEDKVVHWCVLGCCKSDADSINKLLKAVVPFFSRGYSTPLLYRFKHFGPASFYMKVGCTLHNLLPRALGRLQSSSGEHLDPHMSSLLDALLIEPGKQSNGNELETLLADVLDSQGGFAEQNSVRKKLIANEMQKPSFQHHAILVDCLLQPFEHGVNFAFSRTTLLHELCAMGANHPRHDALLQESRSKFLRCVTGKLGRQLIYRYIDTLSSKLYEATEFGLDDCPDFLQKAFGLVVVCCTDTWRRLVFEFQKRPWSLFSLVGMATEEFVATWSEIVSSHAQCANCADEYFTSVLISVFPYDLRSVPGQQELVQREIQSLLLDIATWCPLTSDICEIKNGHVQWLTSRRGRARVLAARASVELSLLQSAVQTQSWVERELHGDTMPSNRSTASILQMSGTKSTNQYTDVDKAKATNLCLRELFNFQSCIYVCDSLEWKQTISWL